MKNFFRILLILLVIIGGVIIYFSNYLLEFAVHPDSDIRHQYDTCFAQVYHKYPEMEAWHDSLVDKGNWRDTTILADDGLKRHAIILQHDSLSLGSSIVLHGYNDNAIRMMRYAYLHYEMLGRNVIVPEHFGHGLSGGDHIRFGWLDHYDIARLWIPCARDLWPTEKIIVHGLSMGGAITMYTAGEEFPDSLHLAGFIEDCGYTSTWEQLAFQLKDQYGLGPVPLLYVANWICQWKYGWNMKDGNAHVQLPNCRRPMLFIHGDADDYVPFYMLQQNYDAKTQGYKEVWVVPGVRHAHSIHDYWDEYVQRCAEFIGRAETMQ